MNMNMLIVMNMNIYITSQNEEHLRKEESMSGLVNKLLDDHYKASAPARAAEVEMIRIKTPAPKNGGVGNISNLDKIKEVQLDKGMEFCKHGAVKGLCKKGCK